MRANSITSIADVGVKMHGVTSMVVTIYGRSILFGRLKYRIPAVVAG